MTRFLRALHLFASRYSTPARPEWTAADQAALTTFLRTGAGSRLRATLISQIAEANERAAFSGKPFDCGWACGYRGLWAWFESLASLQPPPSDGDES